MPEIKIGFYRKEDGSVPWLDWLETIPVKAVVKCRVKLERLRELGHKLRRPEADYLRDGIYELRVALQGIQYRILYFFCKNVAIVLTQGLTKEREVPTQAIHQAIEYKRKFEANPTLHTFEEEVS